MWDKRVTLYLDDTSIRLLVSKAQQVQRWAEQLLETGLVKGSVVADEAEVANRIKRLLQSQKVKTRKVILGFSGLHSLTRPIILPLLPKAMLAEAVAREARRVLPVPLDQLYLSWCTLPSSKERIQVFLVATPRKTADSLVRTLRKAGLEPRRMGIKPLALTRAIPVNTAVLVDVQPTEFDIVVMADGIAQPIRTVPFLEQELTAEDKLNMISHDLERTIKFYDTNNPEKPLAASVPVYVSGQLTGDAHSQKFLGDYVSRPVLELDPAVRGSAQLPAVRYMVNMALSIERPLPGRTPTFPAADLNVLPVPYHPKPISMARVIGIPGGIAVVAFVAPMLLTMQTNSASIASLQNQVTTINQITNEKLAQKQELTKTVTDLQKKSTAAKTAVDNINLSLDAIVTGQQTINGDLELLLKSVPSTITLTSVNESQNTLAITGKSTNEADILSYARGLDLSHRFQGTTVTSIKVAPSSDSSNPVVGNIQFILTFTRKG